MVTVPWLRSSATCATFLRLAARCKGEHEFRSVTFTWHLENTKKSNSIYMDGKLKNEL